MLSRAVLSLLAVTEGATGAWALFAPRSFYRDFPLPGRHWVSALGPYDEHLVRDFGSLSLALAALLAVAAVLLTPLLVRVALGTWLVWAVPHLAFHVAHPDEPDQVANMILLGASVLVPALLLLGPKGDLRVAHRR